MVNIGAPASFSLASLNSQDSNATYLVLSQNGYRVTLANNVCNPLLIGQLVKFKLESQDVSGIIISVTKRQAVAQLSSLVTVTQAVPQDWNPISDRDYLKFYVDPTLIGSMLAICSNTKTLAPGYLGWSLYSEDNQLLVEGNDLQQHNICQFEGQGSWSAGSYTLSVRSFMPVTFSPLTSTSYTWTLTALANTISVGGYNDSGSKLFLT